MKEGLQNTRPQPQVIIPSAAYSGAIISFVLCPSELVKRYEYVRYYMHLQLKAASSDHNDLIDVGIGIVTGGLGGVAFWSAVLPLDVAKTIIQTASDKSSTKNPFRILNSIYRRAGLRGCYTGLGPTIARAFLLMQLQLLPGSLP
ncbi:Mitochondrial arginine transporter BAC1 [Vitis vinifera]|uniref:Mitochondrial arginine transporter BAC1 n=1 Tax=Vitis vinifera TaxID=29760 RepID=A0A438IGN9_VITVI|nr:Mitochondrial arginine transporter BAC1 [Vitis vinifera]